MGLEFARGAAFTRMLVGLAVLLTPLWASAAVPAPPNVVFIIADDQGWGDFGFMGHPVIRTPRLDRLAAESAVFTNGYTTTSLCRASLATIITGLYGRQHRICCNDPPEGIDRARMLPFMREAPALPRLLGAAGYRSLQTGKWWEGHYANGGFTDGMTTQGRHGEEGLRIGRETMQPVQTFLAAGGEKPFFLWYAPMLPHEPHNPPDRLLRHYQAAGRPERLAKYYAMCEWFDETCGQLLDYLDAEKLSANTVVLFCIDNGWIQDTTTTNRAGGLFAPKSKRSPYDGGVRTPVMIRWPGRVTPGRHADLVSTIDLAPTILAATGVRPPPGLPGLSLLPATRGKRLKRDAIFGEIYEHTAIDLGQPALNLKYRWVRAGEWKLIQPVTGEPELYRVTTDPHEETNLASREKSRVRRLTARLDGWWPAR